MAAAGRRSRADFGTTRRNGRELDTLTVGGKKSSYQYDGNGLRMKKTNLAGRYRRKNLIRRKKAKPKPSEAGSVWRGTETERTKISARRCGNLRQRSPL